MHISSHRVKKHLKIQNVVLLRIVGVSILVFLKALKLGKNLPNEKFKMTFKLKLSGSNENKFDVKILEFIVLDLFFF
jgi:hypothetical protein